MFKQIVVGTDGSKSAEVAVSAAINLARLTGATLHVVHAHRVASAAHFVAASEVAMMPVDIVAANQAVHDDGDRICEEVVRAAERVGLHAEAHCVGGDPADALIQVAKRAGADLIVVGNRRMEGLKRFATGSVPNKVSHHCPASLLIVDTHHARIIPSPIRSEVPMR